MHIVLDVNHLLLPTSVLLTTTHCAWFVTALRGIYFITRLFLFIANRYGIEGFAVLFYCIKIALFHRCLKEIFCWSLQPE
jgi:hypothetical protein